MELKQKPIKTSVTFQLLKTLMGNCEARRCRATPWTSRVTKDLHQLRITTLQVMLPSSFATLIQGTVTTVAITSSDAVLITTHRSPITTTSKDKCSRRPLTTPTTIHKTLITSPIRRFWALQVEVLTSCPSTITNSSHLKVLLPQLISKIRLKRSEERETFRK